MEEITGADQFSTPVLKQGGGFDVAIDGTFEGTITVQVSKLTGAEARWMHAADTTKPDILTSELAAAWYVRAGFKSGDYTSGSAWVEVV
ncbi:MAG: hypothetical protein AAF808_03235 [Cyanobacteria bacterium P01_D01_bin.2]